MFRTLYGRLSVALALLLISVGLLYGLLSLSATQQYLQVTGQTLNLDLAKNLVSDRKLVQAGKINDTALRATFMEYMVINPSIELYLLDLNGKILSYSADPGKVKRQSIDLGPINDFLDGKSLPLLGDDPRDYSRQKIFSVTPVPSAQQPEGYLYVVLLGEKYDDIATLIKESLIWQHSAWALIISLSIALLIGILIFRRMTLRLNRLSKAMATFKNPDSDNNIFTPNHIDEIDFLTDSFKHMADRISIQFEDIKKQDDLRRELVANVSHDLRTPIAVLHGYLETLKLKDDQITESDRRRYIDSALQSSAQLQQLITELFELAHLDALKTAPQKESFNLTELIHDDIQKLSLAAKLKSLTFDLQLQDNNYVIEADISLITRLFENLIINAIKFSPTGGNITLQLKQNNNRYVIKITNAGSIILPEDIPFIFDRFYQSQNQSQQNTPGGLGLAIVKRIVELHLGNIDIVSTQKLGTTFIVTLPIR